ncbi:hypothetical protein KA977_02685 [Candidatus Dependentiae bacterium]|nr:hypothetical protein [Candidatus Dependentiae bacterium]
MNIFKVMGLLIIISSLLISCAGNKDTVKKEGEVSKAFEETERMIWTSGERPSWTIEEPKSEGPTMYFVGLSGKNSTENGMREEIRRDSAKQVVNYLGVAVKDHFQQITTKFGLSSDISDATKAARGFEEQLSAGVAKQLKVEKWYFEKWQTKLGEIYYKGYGLAGMPKSMIDQAYKDTIEGEQEKIKEKMKEAKNEQAKKQMQDALNAFEKMKESGFDK